MPLNVELKLDFNSDWKEYLLMQFQHHGYELTEELINKNVAEIAIMYHNFRLRRINISPREVHISKEFNCPPIYKKSLKKLISKIKEGKDINFHISRKIKNLEFKDGLLNHWGIHHLHISSKPGNVEGYNKQKHSELLYIRFVDDQAYLLQILDHTAFTDYDLIKIIHNNWPQTIENHRAHGLSEEKYSKDQLKKFRKSNANTLITIDQDNIYFPLGNGVTLSGHNLFSIRDTDYYLAALKDFEEVIKINTDAILEAIRKQNLTLDQPLHFRLKTLDNINFYAIEDYYNLKIDLGSI